MYGFIATAPKSKEDTRTTLLDKTFKDRDGRVYIAAIPNVPLLAWIVARLLGLVVQGTLHKAAVVVAFAALTVWAGLEVYSGANYFRRALGAAVLIALLVSLIK